MKYILFAILTIFGLSCQKTTTAPSVSGIAALTVVNAIPNTVNGVSPIINSSQAIMWFINANTIYYANFWEYAAVGGEDTIYAVQNNSQDTLAVGPKVTGQIFFNVLNLKKGDIYSLFLCGADTTSPDYLLVQDTLPYYSLSDSVTGIRFVNLSSGSGPISINVEGNSNGSEVESLPYKGITGFKRYENTSITQDYCFVIRDAITGDSLTQFDFLNSGSYNNGHGLIDISNNNYGNLLTFKNVTIALIGQPGTNAAVPQTAILVDDY